MSQTTFPRSLLTILAGVVLAAALLPLSACKSGVREDPILRLAADESLQEGKALMEREKFARARRYLSHAFEIEPNSLSGREALLLLADSFYLDGGAVHLVQAEAKYRDFLNRFPTSDRADYAQFQVARSLSGRMEKPDRDQKATAEAIAAFSELIRLYPTSEHVAESREEISRIRGRLAEHEFLVANFYLRRGIPIAAVARLEDMLEKHPDYAERDKVLYHLGLAYHRSRSDEHSGKARTMFDQLREDFPDSSWIAEIPDPSDETEKIAIRGRSNDDADDSTHASGSATDSGS